MFKIVRLKYRNMKKIVLLLLSLCVLFLSISAGCTTTIRNFDSEGHKSISDTDDLQLVDSNFRVVTEIGGQLHTDGVVGHIKNNSDRTFRNVKVKINLYKNGEQIGSWTDTVSNFEPNGIWAFRTPAIG